MRVAEPGRVGCAAVRVIVLWDGVESRRRLLLDLLGPGVEAEWSTDAVPAEATAVLVDAPAAADAGALERLADRGGSVVVLGGGTAALTEVTGVLPSDARPHTEWLAVVDRSAGPLVERLPGDVPVVDRFVPLSAGGGMTILAAVSVGFADLAAVVERPLGSGRVVTFGFGAEALAAAPDLAVVLRRALRPRAEPPARRGPVGLGIVGYGPFGGMGYYHGLAARATEGLEFVATCDTSDERRKAAEADFPGVRTYATAEELAGDGEVDVVVIATPPAFHARLALDMLRAGKHVACEKPLCLTAADADLLIDTARDVGAVLTVHQNRRWDADFAAIRRAVDGGLLGELFNVETFVGGYEHPCRAWHSEVSVSGGAVYDWGSHHVDWIRQLFGSPPAVVQTHGHKRVWHDVTNLDQLRVRMTWADGREAEFLQSDVAAVRRPKFYVQGTAGTLVGQYRPVTFERVEPGWGYVAEAAHHAEAPADLVLARYESGIGISETRLALAPPPRFAFHRNLADHLLLGEPLAVTPESVRAVIGVLEAAQRSSDEGNVAVTPA